MTSILYVCIIFITLKGIHMILRTFILSFFISIFSAYAYAQNSSSGLGPDTGTTIPHDLSLMNTSGKVENFDALKGDNGLAIFFVRSFDWCPYCQQQAIEVNGRASEFRDRSINPIFISYDTATIQKTFFDRHNFTMPILSDAENVVINAFDVLNKDSISERSPLYGYPHPIVFLVGPDGKTQDKLYIENENSPIGSSYKDRPEIDIILAAIDDMN
jgi:peroxiredoxin